METSTELFGSLLLFVYHCFHRAVIHGYLSGLSRPGQGVHFFQKRSGPFHAAQGETHGVLGGGMYR